MPWVLHNRVAHPRAPAKVEEGAMAWYALSGPLATHLSHQSAMGLKMTPLWSSLLE